MNDPTEKRWGPYRDGKGMEFSVRLHHRGLWRPLSWQKTDLMTFGKATMVIEITNPDLKTMVDYSPTHADICKVILEVMLQAELDNDTFMFLDGAYGPNSRRPTQIFKKIEQVRQVLGQWELRAKSLGLAEPLPSIMASSPQGIPKKFAIGDFY